MAIVFFGRFSQFFLALVMMRALTTLMLPSEVGRAFLLTSATAFFALIFINPVGMFITRRVFQWRDSGNLNHYLSYYWIYLLFVSFISSFILSALQILGVVDIHTKPIWLFLLTAGSLLIGTINLTVIPLLNTFGYINFFILFTIGTLLSGFIFALILIYFYGAFAEYWLLGILCGQFLFGLVGYRYLSSKTHSLVALSKINFNSESPHVKVLFSFAWPISISVLLGWIQNQSYRYLLGDAQGLSVLGLFVAGYGISVGILTAFESIWTTYFQPHYYKKITKSVLYEQELAWESYASSIIPSLILMVIFIILVAPELTIILLGRDFQSSVQFIFWGALAEGFRVISNVYSLASHAIMKTRLLIVANFFAAIVSVILIKFLIPIFGPAGVGFALVSSGLLLFIGLHYSIGSTFKLKLPKGKIIESISYGCLLYVFVGMWRLSSMPQTFLITSLFVLGIGVVFSIMQYRLVSNSLSNR